MIINFPKGLVQVRKRDEKNEIFDPIRRRWLHLTPEEWVRQHWIQFLHTEKKFPLSLMAVEKEIRLGELKKRCDLVLYDRDTNPYIIIECKEPEVSLSEKTLEQILRYHISLPAHYLIISNGTYSYGFQKMNNQFVALQQFPETLL